MHLLGSDSNKIGYKFKEWQIRGSQSAKLQNSRARGILWLNIAGLFNVPFHLVSRTAMQVQASRGVLGLQATSYWYCSCSFLPYISCGFPVKIIAAVNPQFVVQIAFLSICRQNGQQIKLICPSPRWLASRKLVRFFIMQRPPKEDLYLLLRAERGIDGNWDSRLVKCIRCNCADSSYLGAITGTRLQHRRPMTLPVSSKSIGITPISQEPRKMQNFKLTSETRLSPLSSCYRRISRAMWFRRRLSGPKRRLSGRLHLGRAPLKGMLMTWMLQVEVESLMNEGVSETSGSWASRRRSCCLERLSVAFATIHEIY